MRAAAPSSAWRTTPCVATNHTTSARAASHITAYSTDSDQPVQGSRSPSVGGREAVDGEPGLSP
jgi:hypothetical protein